MGNRMQVDTGSAQTNQDENVALRSRKLDTMISSGEGEEKYSVHKQGAKVGTAVVAWTRNGVFSSAFCGVYDSEFCIQYIGVDECNRGEGIGSDMVQRLISFARQAGYSVITTCVSSGLGNPTRNRLIRFFQNQGFVHDPGNFGSMHLVL